jgi:hypothetical protein
MGKVPQKSGNETREVEKKKTTKKKVPFFFKIMTIIRVFSTMSLISIDYAQSSSISKHRNGQSYPFSRAHKFPTDV